MGSLHLIDDTHLWYQLVRQDYPQLGQVQGAVA